MEPETVQTPVTGGEASNRDDKPIVVRELGEVTKNQTTKILLRVLEMKGWRYVDMRLMDLKGKRWLFSSKGLTLNRNTFSDVIAKLADHRDEIEELLNPLEVTDP